MYWDKFEDRVDRGENRWERSYKEEGKKLPFSFPTIDIIPFQ
jgi:hypothetical protein